MADCLALATSSGDMRSPMLSGLYTLPSFWYPATYLSIMPAAVMASW